MEREEVLDLCNDKIEELDENGTPAEQVLLGNLKDTVWELVG